MKSISALKPGSETLKLNSFSFLKGNSSILSKIFLSFSLLIAGTGIVLGLASFSLNSLEAYPKPVLGALGIIMLLLFFYFRHIQGCYNWKLLVLMASAIFSIAILAIMPEYFYAFELDGIFHRSIISAILLLAVSIPSLCYLLFYFLGVTPTAHDLSHYPLIILPVILILAAFSLIIYQITVSGIPNLNWEMLTTPYIWDNWKVVVWQDDWPVWKTQYIHQTGIFNYILGTFLLVVLTAIISLPIGMAVGIYITEYSSGWLANIIKYPCNLLRSISIFILGLAAFSIVSFSNGTFLSDILAGFYYDMNGVKHTTSGSFITASIIISLLVIPIIARATEEGIRSTPVEMKEGSLALGTSRLYTLLHILIPWSIPSIITGLLLGCAEAAGSLATIWFIAGTGENGINPLNEVTSLSYFIYYYNVGVDMNFTKQQGIYEYAAAFILIVITIGLSIAALILKKRFSNRYRGS